MACADRTPSHESGSFRRKLVRFFVFRRLALRASAPFAMVIAALAALQSSPSAAAPQSSRLAGAGAVLLSESFAGKTTQPNLWATSGGACLTAADRTTPPTSIGACAAGTTLDASGGGALQLTDGAGERLALAVARTPFSTQNGLRVTFTAATFDGTNPGGQGALLFFADASQPLPTTVSAPHGSLGYAPWSAHGVSFPGLAGAYLGVALDEYGAFGMAADGRIGGTLTRVSQTVSARGGVVSGYAYLGGVRDALSGDPASLPFALDAPGAKTRPAAAPSVAVTLRLTGLLDVRIDRHDGKGFVAYYSQQVAGTRGEPRVPARVYVGFTSATWSFSERHQVRDLTVTTAPPAAAFDPSQIAGLQAWYDPSLPAGMTNVYGAITSVSDLSGNGNAVAQSDYRSAPSFAASGFNGLRTLTFLGNRYLTGANGFSQYLFGESSVFAVTDASASTLATSPLWSGAAAGGTPAWNFAVDAGGSGVTYDFGDVGTGRLAANVRATGPALWTALGSVSHRAQSLRKDGALVAAGTAPSTAASGSFPLAVGVAQPGGSAPGFRGQLGEMLFFNRYVAASEAAQVEGYLACKWGLQNRLPANHPYRFVCPQGGSYPSAPLGGGGAGALADPPQLRSQNGQLVFNVVAAQNGSGAPQLTYNGSPVPPTLRVLPGDTLIVNLTNNLPVPPAGSGYVNDTNLHYHGLHVNPNAPADDSIDMLALPGQSLHYRIPIPANHPPGLYWYHSHAHGEAERQNLSGMSGALIVDGISRYAPQIANLPERILIARDAMPAGRPLPAANVDQLHAMGWAMAHATNERGVATPSMKTYGMTMNVAVRGRSTASTRNPYVTYDRSFRRFVRPAASTHCIAGSPESPSRVWTLNGQTAPSIGIRPGEQQFWRLVNAGSDTYLDLQVDNAQMQVVALDGVPLALGGSPALTVSHYVVPPSSRIEFVVKGPVAGTTAYLRTNCFDSGSGGLAMPAATLATLDATRSPTDAARRGRERVARTKSAARSPVAFAASLRRRRNGDAALRQQTLIYSDQNTVNGQSYDPGAPPQFYVQSGTMEKWQIVNNSSQVHTFHIHQIHFLVDAVVGGTAIEQSEVGQVIDNINVPAASANGAGSVTLTMDFRDPAIVGTFLLHCHILSHEDQGMMAKIRVGTAPPMTTSVSALHFATATSGAQNVTVIGGKSPYSVAGCAGVANARIAGNVVTVTPAAAGQCVLVVSDASGLSATVSIAVDGAASPLVVTPKSLAFKGPNAHSATASLAGGTLPYVASGCSGVASVRVSVSTITVSPLATGACVVVAADAAKHSASLSVTVNGVTTGSAADNLTYHRNNARQGWYANETALTTANVASSAFGLVATLTDPAGASIFGKVFAQPLFVSGETIAGVKHNLVVVATATDRVYAYDEATRALVWHRDFTNAAAGITQQSWADTGCRDVNPDIGITATPVIDRRLDRVFVVAATKENGAFHQRLHAISLQTGADAVTPVEASATVALSTGGVASTDAKWNYARAALLAANGNVYVGLSDHCDFNAKATHGWMLAYAASTLAPAGGTIDITDADDGTGYFLGSVWMSGFGPAADAAGNVYFATGNGPVNDRSDFAMSVLKVPGTLDVTAASYFTIADAARASQGDADVGSGGVMLLPDGISAAYPHMVVQGGKTGRKYLLNADKLGGQQPGDAGAIWYASTGGLEWGGPAYFADAAGRSYVLYGSGPLTTYRLDTSGARPALRAVASTTGVACFQCRVAGSLPIVSSNGTAAGTAIAWVVQDRQSGAGGPLNVFAFDALTMRTLFSSTAGTWMPGPGLNKIGAALVSPLVANGRVYVPTDGHVAIYGLKR